jgi:hypothetical protein
MVEYTAQYNSGWYLLATRAEMWVTEGEVFFINQGESCLSDDTSERPDVEATKNIFLK